MPPNTDSKVSFAKTTLPFPIFSADFDPYNRDYLVVGGGGGESKTGVPNQITALDVRDRSALSTVVDIELSREEDSVVSLGNLGTKDGLIVFAGINSSEAEQQAGKNEHLRSFEIKYPPRKKQKTEKDGKVRKNDWKLLGKRSLFRSAPGPKAETYQRILRLSPAQRSQSGSKRIGAVATGMAKTSEIVVFNATNPTPEKADVLTQINLPAGSEANDLDLIEPESSEFSLCYCTDYGLYEQSFKYNFGKKTVEKRPKGPRKMWEMPFPEASEAAKSRPKVRCLRFLNEQNVLLLCNKPVQSGSELRIFHLYPTGPGMEMAQMALPKRIKQAISMDVCALDADEDGNQQFIIAVAGQDVSVEVYTTDYNAQTDTCSRLKKYITLKNVHEHQMTKVCFSPFHAPPKVGDGADSKDERQNAAKTLFVRLASVSYGNTVVVDTFPVEPLNAESGDSRYVLNQPGDEAWVKWAYILITSLIVLVVAFIIQSFRGGFSNDSQAGPFGLLPKNVRDFLDKPAAAAYRHGRTLELVSPSITESSVVAEGTPTPIPPKSRLRDLLHMHHSSPVRPTEDGKQPTVVISAPAQGSAGEDEGEGLSVDFHVDKDEYRAHDKDAKHWDELQEHERARWRQRLINAGEWAEGESEKILLGVLFSEYAGVVGEVAHEVLREL